MKKITKKELINFKMLNKDFVYTENQIKDFSDNTLIFALINNKKIISVAIFLDIKPELELFYIYTSLDFRNKKYASDLLNKAFEYFNEENFEKCFLEVSVDNFIAISFYNKIGFENISIRKNYYENSDAIIMKKNILQVI